MIVVLSAGDYVMVCGHVILFIIWSAMLGVFQGRVVDGWRKIWRIIRRERERGRR